MIAFILKLSLYAYAQNCQNSLPTNFTFFIVSNSNTFAKGPDMPIEGNAVHCQTDPAWIANIPGATWIWDRYSVSNLNTEQIAIFRTEIAIPGVPLAVTLRIASDNNSNVTINGKNPGCQGAWFNAGSEKNCSLLPFLVSGINSVVFTVISSGGPAGLLYSIEVITSI